MSYGQETASPEQDKDSTPEATMAKTAKKSGRGKRYTKSEKAKILAAAKKGNMTGQQASKKFGISMLTFYRWRGPVRGGKKRGRPVGSKNRVAAGKVKVDLAAVRREVQAQVRSMLPQIISVAVRSLLIDAVFVRTGIGVTCTSR